MTSSFRPQAAKHKEIRIGNNSTPSLVKSSQVSKLIVADQNRVLQIKKQLNSLDSLSLINFGDELHTQSSTIADDMVKHLSVGELGEIGKRMVDIMGQTQKVNIGLLRKPGSKVPVVGQLINKIRNVKGKVKAQYSNVCTYVADMTTQVDATCSKLEQNVTHLERLYTTTEGLYKDVNLHMIALQARHEEVAAETDDFARKLTPESNPFDHQQVVDARRYLNDIEVAYANFKAFSLDTMQTALRIRAAQQNSITVIQKFGTIKKFVFPSWKKKFAMILAMEDTLQAVQLGNSLVDANNQLARDTATMFKSSSVEVAKSNQRGVYDLETLEFVQQEMLTAAQEVVSITSEGTAQRQELITRADQMKLEFLPSIVKEVKNG